MGKGEFHTGLVAGSLVDLPVRAALLTIDLRYEVGFASMDGRSWFAFPGVLVLPDFDPFDGFQVSLGLGFPSTGAEPSG